MSAAVPAATASTATTWTIDPVHSSVEFAVRHLMITTVKGRFTEVGGTVVLDEAEPSRSTAEITIGAGSIDTREAQRDAHLRSADFFEAEAYPSITFRSTRIDGALDRTFTLVGDLTIHGVTREVSLSVTPEGRSPDPWGGTRVGFSAATKIKRSDFGLTWNQLLETGGLAVSDEVRISIDLQLIGQPAQA